MAPATLVSRYTWSCRSAAQLFHGQFSRIGPLYPLHHEGHRQQSCEGDAFDTVPRWRETSRRLALARGHFPDLLNSRHGVSFDFRESIFLSLACTACCRNPYPLRPDPIPSSELGRSPRTRRCNPVLGVGACPIVGSASGQGLLPSGSRGVWFTPRASKVCIAMSPRSRGKHDRMIWWLDGSAPSVAT